MSFFNSISILFYVVISKISSKKKRVKFLNIFENEIFFRNTKMSNDDAKIKNVKNNYQFL